MRRWHKSGGSFIHNAAACHERGCRQIEVTGKSVEEIARELMTLLSGRRSEPRPGESAVP